MALCGAGVGPCWEDGGAVVRVVRRVMDMEWNFNFRGEAEICRGCGVSDFLLYVFGFIWAYSCWGSTGTGEDIEG